MTEHNLPANKLAMVIDGEVVDILHIDNRLAAILLSEPKIIDISDIYAADNNAVRLGTKYDENSKEFVNIPVEG